MTQKNLLIELKNSFQNSKIGLQYQLLRVKFHEFNDLKKIFGIQNPELGIGNSYGNNKVTRPVILLKILR